MTIGFYESIDEPLIFRLTDFGAGVPCKILEFERGWAKVELTTGRVGYIDFSEPVTTTTPMHY